MNTIIDYLISKFRETHIYNVILRRKKSIATIDIYLPNVIKFLLYLHFCKVHNVNLSEEHVKCFKQLLQNNLYELKQSLGYFKHNKSERDRIVNKAFDNLNYNNAGFWECIYREDIKTIEELDYMNTSFEEMMIIHDDIQLAINYVITDLDYIKELLINRDCADIKKFVETF